MSVETPWPAADWPGELEHDARLAERVLAAGHRVDAELAQPRLALRRRVDRAEDRVDRAVAGEVADDLLVVGRADRDARVRRAPVGDVDVEPLERVGAQLVAELVGDERLEVHRGHGLLAVGDLLEALERGVQRLAVDLEAQLLQRALERVPARVLAEHEVVALQPDRRGVHDLVRRAVLEHAVLVDAGLVRERVAPDDRLVRLHRVAGEARDHPAGARDLARGDAGRVAQVVGARVAAASRSPRATRCRRARRCR